MSGSLTFIDTESTVSTATSKLSGGSESCYTVTFLPLSIFFGKLKRFVPKFFCLSNRKFERLGGPLDEIVTVFVHKYNVIMSRPNLTSFDSRDRLPRRWLLHFIFYDVLPGCTHVFWGGNVKRVVGENQDFMLMSLFIQIM